MAKVKIDVLTRCSKAETFLGVSASGSEGDGLSGRNGTDINVATVSSETKLHAVYETTVALGTTVRRALFPATVTEAVATKQETKVTTNLGSIFMATNMVTYGTKVVAVPCLLAAVTRTEATTNVCTSQRRGRSPRTVAVISLLVGVNYVDLERGRSSTTS